MRHKRPVTRLCSWREGWAFFSRPGPRPIHVQTGHRDAALIVVAVGAVVGAAQRSKPASSMTATYGNTQGHQVQQALALRDYVEQSELFTNRRRPYDLLAPQVFNCARGQGEEKSHCNRPRARITAE